MSSSSSASQSVTLLDLASRPPCKTWSLNPWKTRLFLNFKGIPYTTRWTSYPDIEATLSPHVAPHPESLKAIKPYTVPAVILADGSWIQESLAIAERLNVLYPEPALAIHTAILPDLLVLMQRLIRAASPAYIARIPRRLLDARNQEFWLADRGRMVGMPVDDFQDARGSAAQLHEASAADVRCVGQWLRRNSSGPFFEGDTVTYADFIWAAFLLFLQRIGTDAFDLLIVEEREVHVGFLEEFRKRGWAQRDDH